MTPEEPDAVMTRPGAPESGQQHPPRPLPDGVAAAPPGPSGAPYGDGGSSRRSSLASESLLILLARVISASSTAVLTIILARSLGTDGFGLYALAMAVGLMIGLLADLGVPSSTAHFMAVAYPDQRRMGAVLRRGLHLKAGLALGISVLTAALAYPIAWVMGEPDLAPLFLVGAGVIFFRDIMGATAELLQTLRYSRATAVSSLTKALSEIGAVLLFIALGLGAVGAMFGSAIGFYAAAVVALLLLAPTLRAPAPEAPPPSARTIVGYGSQIWLAGLAWSTFLVIDQVLLGLFLDASAVAIYDAPWRLAFALVYIGLALASAVGPRLATDDRAAAATLMLSSLRLAVVFYAVIGLVMLVSASTLMPVLLGAEFAESSDVLIVLTPYIALLGVAPLVSIGLNYLGSVRERKWIGAGAVAINVVLDLILIPTLGVIGPAIATNVAMLFYVGGHFWLCRRLLRFPMRPLIATTVRATLAGAAGAGLAASLIAQAPGPALVRVAIGATAGLAAGWGLLLLRGEVGRRTLAEFRAAPS